jgi:hypothetical protein
MNVNSVIVNGETLIDLSNDTVTEESLLQGYTAHNADGEIITGTKTFEKEVVIIPGHYDEINKFFYINVEDTDIIKNYQGEFLLYIGFEGVLVPFYEDNTFMLHTPTEIILVQVDLDTGICAVTEKNIDNLIVDWQDIVNKPINISYFNNDKNYLTDIPDEYVTETELNNKNFITQTDLNNKGYLDKIPDEYITETELNNKEYITQTDLNNKGYLDKIPDEYITETELNNKGYITNEELNQKGYLDKIPDEYITETELNNKEYITSQDLSPYAKTTDLSQVAKDGKYSSLDGIPASFPPSTHDHKDLYYTKKENDDVIEELVDSINKKADADEIDDIRATAEGKCKSYILDNKE